MNLFEKIFTVFAVLFAAGIITLLLTVPETRNISILLPLSFCGLLVNIGLMFVVLKDIFTRPRLEKQQKFVWTAIILVVWPAIPIYLLLHGFKSRTL